jgi:predicted transcriptional regulator
MHKSAFWDWIDGQPARLTAVAELLGVTKSAVSQWRKNGVPLKRIPALAKLSGVPLEVLASEAARAKARS